jgi:hypothetical protein
MSNIDPITIYGYRITVPATQSSAFIRDMCSMNDILDAPVQVYCMVRSPEIIYEHAVRLILGFVPDHDLKITMGHFEVLDDLIANNPMFDGIEFASAPRFHIGFKWNGDLSSDAESEAESEESLDSGDVSSSEGSSDCSSEHSDDCSEEEDQEEEEEEEEEEAEERAKDDKHLAYYVSKYYI